MENEKKDLEVWSSIYQLQEKVGWLKGGLIVALTLAGFLFVVEVGESQGWFVVGHQAHQNFSVVWEKTIAIMTADGASTAMGLSDTQKRLRVVLVASDNGHGLTYLDANGNKQAEFAASSRGPILRFFDAKGVTRIQLSLLDDQPELLFHDENGNVLSRSP